MTVVRKPARAEQPPEPMHPRIHELSPFYNGDIEKRRAVPEPDETYPNLALVKGGLYVGRLCLHAAPKPETNDCRFGCAS